MDRNEIEMQHDDEISGAVARAMVSVVAVMALIIMATVLVFSSGGGLA